VAKTIGAGHDGRANIRLARLPIASRAKRAGANSHVPVLIQSRLAPAWRRDARRHATAPEARSTRPSVACTLGGWDFAHKKARGRFRARQTHTVNFFCEKNKTCAGEFLR